jgi:hypothetical protein
MGDWTENTYAETRFGGMDHSVEPHTLDRDTGLMADEFNLLSRTMGLRTRKGWRQAADLTLNISGVPGVKNTPVGLIPYDTGNLAVVDDSGEGEQGEDGGAVVGGLPVDGEGDSGIARHEKEGVALELTAPASVVAQVPFTLSAAADGTYRGGDARLLWAFKEGGTPNVSMNKGIRAGWDSNAWSATATVNTVNRDKTKIFAVLFRSNAVQDDANIAYSVASMVPDIPANISTASGFSYTISCTHGGSVQTGYTGRGSGVVRKWEALDADGKVVSCSVTGSSGTWSNGVGTFTGRITSLARTAVKLRLKVTYAGEELVDEATLTRNAQLTAPASLHTLGPSGALNITAVGFDPADLSLAATMDGQAVTLSDYLEMADGSPISVATGWTDGIWSGNIRAKTGAVAGTLSLKLMDGSTQLAAVSIGIDDSLSGTITAPAIAWTGDDIEVSAALDSTNLDAARIPAGLVSLVVRDGHDVWKLEYNEAGTTTISAQLEDLVAATLTAELCVTATGEVLASAEISVMTMKAALAEAINERIYAKDGSPGSYSDSDSLYTLWGGAKSAMRYFANADGIAADGTYTAYDNTAESTGIPDPREEGTDESAWLEDAYAKVCTAVARSRSYSSAAQKLTASGSYQFDPIPDPDHPGEYITSGTEAEARRLAAAAMVASRTSADWAIYTSFKSYTYGDSYQSYNAWCASCSTQVWSFRVKADGTSPFARKADIYYKATKDTTNYSNLGHHSLAQNETGKLLSSEAPAGETFDWAVKTISHPDASAIDWNAGSTGYKLAIQTCIITFGFKHK